MITSGFSEGVHRAVSYFSRALPSAVDGVEIDLVRVRVGSGSSVKVRVRLGFG